MGMLKYFNINYLSRLIRQNRHVTYWLLLAGYIVASNLSRTIVTKDVDESRDNIDIRSITLKPGLIELINATEEDFRSTYSITYLMQNKHLCSATEKIDVVVMVYTATINFERRNILRQTWLNETILSGLGTARFVFLLGRTNDTSLQSEIDKEFNKHKDILQGDFMDTYANLTLKGLMGLKWLSENCKNAKILIKADDDIVINIYRFFKEIVPEMLSQKQQVFCWRSARSIIFRGIRHKSYLPKNYFYGQHSYPLYCKGPFVFLTFDLVPLILKSASMTPFLWLEDVYLYGLVMQNIPGIKYKQFKKGVDFHLDIGNVVECFNKTVCQMFVAGVSKADEMMPVWIAMLKQSQSLR